MSTSTAELPAPVPMELEAALGTIAWLRSEVEQLDAQIVEVNTRYVDELTPINEKRSRFMAMWQSIYNLLPDLAIEASPPMPSATPQEPNNPFVVSSERRTPRGVMFDLLKATNGPVSADALWTAVQAAGLQTKMSGAELVYQTLYHARRKGYPVARNDDGSWHWVRDEAAA